jgi:hypothetical protein
LAALYLILRGLAGLQLAGPRKTTAALIAPCPKARWQKGLQAVCTHGGFNDGSRAPAVVASERNLLDGIGRIASYTNRAPTFL